MFPSSTEAVSHQPIITRGGLPKLGRVPMDTKTSVIKNVHGIIEDHQRRLFLDLASYVDQQLSKHLTERGTRSEKRTRFDSDDVVVRDEV